MKKGRKSGARGQREREQTAAAAAPEIEAQLSSAESAALASALRTMARSFAVIALRLAPSKPAQGPERAIFLKGLGLDQNAIAAIMNTTPGTVGTWLWRAKSGRRPGRGKKQSKAGRRAPRGKNSS